MSTHITSLEFGGLTLQCHATVTRGERAQLSGPPEYCHPGSPDEVELECVFLEAEVTDDLGLNAPPRKVEIDITEMLREIQPGGARRFEANKRFLNSLTPVDQGWLRNEFQTTALDTIAEIVGERVLAQLDDGPDDDRDYDDC